MNKIISNFTGNDVSPTFCILPWIHLSTRPNGHLRLCCTANASSAGKTNDKKWGGEVGILKNSDGKPANLNTSDLNSAWNNSYMKTTRQMMLKGEIPNSCSKCFKEEAAGHRSKRNWETEYWKKRLSIKELVENTKPCGEVKPQISYLDLRLGTKCNLKCIMCSPHDSSMWIKDWNQLYPRIENPDLKEIMIWNNKGKVDDASYNWHVDNPVFWEQLYSQLPNIKQLYFAGGEATIIKEHYALLKKCIDRGYASKIQLRYNSNGVDIPESLFDLWSEFESVRFHFSIDNINEMNDYIRFPSKFNEISDQLRRLDSLKGNYEFTIACAVQVLNIYYIPDMIKWKLSQEFKNINTFSNGAGLINYHFVYHPAHLNVKVLPNWFKERVEEKYNDFYIWLKENYRNDDKFLNHSYGIKRLKGMVNFMKSEDWSNRLPQLEEYLYHMDSIRNTDFKDIFPEMSEIFRAQS